jgi:hypothetical protein
MNTHTAGFVMLHAQNASSRMLVELVEMYNKDIKKV